MSTKWRADKCGFCWVRGKCSCRFVLPPIRPMEFVFITFNRKADIARTFNHHIDSIGTSLNLRNDAVSETAQLCINLLFKS